jgi:hypothetical protein
MSPLPWDVGSSKVDKISAPNLEDFKMQIGLRLPARNLPMLLIAVIIFVSACSNVRLISDYDEPTDKALTALQQSTDDFVTKLISNAPSEDNAFEKHKKFYEDADQQLRRLEFRVASIPKNDKTKNLVSKIRSSILGDGKCSEDGESLKDLHCLPANLARGPSKVALQISQRNVNQTIGAALALELAKKQGFEQNK